MGTALATGVLADAGNEERITAAALSCFARWGVNRTTLDDIARESGLSRATIYRVFPGGKEVLAEAVLAAEITRFYGSLSVELDAAEELEDLLTIGVGSAMRFLLGHEALRAVIELDPELVLPQCAFHRLGPLLKVATGFVVPYIRPHVPDPSDAVHAAQHVVRVVLSYTLAPSPALDPADEDSVRRFVRTYLIPAIVTP